MTLVGVPHAAVTAQKCANELEMAEWAHEYIRDGGSYIIVIGAALPDKLVETRRRSVAEKAQVLGLIASDDPDRIRVYDSNRLARWASQFPALAVSTLSGGPGSVAIDFDQWAAGRTHDKAWVSDERAVGGEPLRLFHRSAPSPSKTPGHRS